MSNRILVLGATGNIGTFLVQDLKEINADLIGGVPSSDLGKLRKLDVDGVAVDFNDPGSLDNALKGVDSLFMLLPLNQQMTAWGRNIIEAAKRNDVKFVLRSSIIDAAPDSPYMAFRVHGEIDRMLRESGIPYSIVHPNSFMQNFAVYLAGNINKDNAFYYMRGDAKVSYNDVRDIAAVDAEIIVDPESNRNKEYTLSGPEALSGEEIAIILSGVAGRTIRYVSLSESDYLEMSRKAGLSPWNIDINLSLELHILNGKQAALTDTVQTILGRPPVSFEQFARDYANTWKKAAVSA